MVERAVRSVLAQDRPPDEIIVVDDASGDETGDRAAALGARVITHEQNRGEGGSRNTGLAAAKHEWVALLDCDDEWLPAHLATLWPARDDHLVVGGAALVVGGPHGDHRVFGWAGRRPCVMTEPPDVAVPQNKLVPSAVLLRRDAALAAGGFRSLPRAADLDMWLRLLENGTALAVPRVTALYHVHGGQVSTDQQLMDEAHRAVLDSHASRPWCTPSLLHRHEGVVAWDTARAAWADGSPRLRPGVDLMRRLAHPQRAVGVAQLLAGRFMQRRLASSVELPGGGR
jgi:glycosyltransferase involved in cell wall biosynthesis